MPDSIVRIGTAGWRLDVGDALEAGTHLERYGRRLSCAEINSSFYRSHRASTYGRWAASVPPGFRFSLKVPKEVTHVRRLVGVDDALERFLDESAHLGDKRGPLLLQLPPSFAYDRGVVEPFFADLRGRYEGLLVCEPRHASWFQSDADALLRAYHVARVAADPAPVPAAADPGGWDGFAYFRLHGSPRVYYSAYDRPALESYAQRLRAASTAAWCIFDNTAHGEATANALALQTMLNDG